MKFAAFLCLAAPLLAAADQLVDLRGWGDVGAMGLLGWYLWYSTSVAQPRTQRHYETVVRDVEAAHKAQIEMIIKTCPGAK